ncbi:MAG TPA: HlyD family efflux transporter periplasmic adaptor subunit [Planctomycetota bacterium]|nr:HlyD family efflux transporter periplasmic adaptor subunit [Planctomycetota bacterium]
MLSSSETASPPVSRRHDLIIRPVGESGECVVKDPASASYYQLGAEEAFLLSALDGTRNGTLICDSYQQRFNKALTESELQEFIDYARAVGFVGPLKQAPDGSSQAQAEPAQPQNSLNSRQSILYWRMRLFSPDALLNRLEPGLRFLFTPALVMFLTAAGLFSAGIVWFNRAELISQFADALRPRTLFLAWLCIASVTLIHEFAHGLACKRFGGRVSEIGFLLMFLMPCFYCNVSDAWLFRERYKRVWVTLAGPCCDVLLWSAAVLIWRVSMLDSLLNYLAWITLSVLGVRILLNFNPLMRLDGYYLLSDCAGVTNLQQTSWEYVRAHLRWALFGCPFPGRLPRSTFLLIYGTLSWWYAFIMLGTIAYFLTCAAAAKLGVFGILLGAGFGVVLLRGIFRGFWTEEARMSLGMRRLLFWSAVLCSIVAALVFIKMDDTVTANMLIRATRRAEVRASAAGFLREVHVSDGDRVNAKARIARIEIPDLQSRLNQKRLEIEELEARQRLLSAGVRQEEIKEARERIKRSEAWLEVAKAALKQRKLALDAELTELDWRIRQFKIEVQGAEETFTQTTALLAKGAISQQEHNDRQRKLQVLQTQLEQIQAQRAARQAAGTQEKEDEIARRELEVSEARGRLALLQAGTRVEELEAIHAQIARLREEHCFLEIQQQRLNVESPVGGLVATPHLAQKIGQYVREGEVICEVEDPRDLNAELVLSEQDASLVGRERMVSLYPRVMPMVALSASVERLATRVVPGQAQGSLTVYCQLKEFAPELRPGMTGHARIHCGRKPLGQILYERLVRSIRTEFWW